MSCTERRGEERRGSRREGEKFREDIVRETRLDCDCRSCKGTSATMDHAHLQQAQEQTAYTLDLYKQVLKLEELKDNAVMSPMSIATALAMTAGGCRGETLAQFAAHLKHPDSENMHQLSMQINNSIFREGSDSAGPYLASASGLWVDERTPLNPKFRRFVKHNYGGEAQEADFRTKVCTLHSLCLSGDPSLFRLKPRCL